MADITWALKEWAVAVDALLSGDLILLVRKGGIHETKPVFNVPSDRGLLFPTYEHQSVDALRAPWNAQVEVRSVPPIGETIELPGWAEVTHQLELQGPDIVQRLHPFHIWTDAWLAERLAWKPERPAYALLLRVHRFGTPLRLTYEKRYGGCRSWLELTGLTALPESVPVLTDVEYQRRENEVAKAIAPVSASSASDS